MGRTGEAQELDMSNRPPGGTQSPANQGVGQGARGPVVAGGYNQCYVSPTTHLLNHLLITTCGNTRSRLRLIIAGPNQIKM